MNSPSQQILRDHWRFIGAIAVAFAAVTAVVVIRSPREFIAHGSFLPQGGDASRSRLTGLAAQFGINVPSGDRGQSPDFFAELVKSRTVLDSAVARGDNDSTGAGSRSIELARLFNIAEEDPDVRHDRLIDAVNRRLLVIAGLRTGIVAIDFRAPSRQVATNMVANIIEQVNRFVVASKRRQAAEEGTFAQQRLDNANQELRKAEDSLVAFSEANRIAGAPRLQVDRERLQRSIDIRQQVVTTIAQLYEQARIDAQRRTPSIVLIDAPASLARPLSRHLLSKVGIAAILGAVFALAGLVADDKRTPQPSG